MKTKVGILSLMMAVGVGESWLSIVTSIVMLITAVYCLGANHAD